MVAGAGVRMMQLSLGAFFVVYGAASVYKAATVCQATLAYELASAHEAALLSQAALVYKAASVYEAASAYILDFSIGLVLGFWHRPDFGILSSA